jgi:uncharacterized protein (TIGR02246 family)
LKFDAVVMTMIEDTVQYLPNDQVDELAAIRDLVATIARAQQQELVDDFVALFRADAIWTTGHGKRLFGRNAIAEFTATVLPGSGAHGRATYEVEHVLFVRPDVAAVKVRQRYYDVNGHLDSEGTPMYVLAKEEGRWLLTANQNTPVVAG